MKTTEDSKKETVSVRIDAKLLARIKKYCAHAREVYKIEITPPAAMRALIELGLDAHEQKRKSAR
jgi:hypothetical protein